MRVEGRILKVNLDRRYDWNGWAQVDYTPPETGALQDLAGNRFEETRRYIRAEGDIKPPALLHATVNGRTLTLAYDETWTATTWPSTEDYHVTVNGERRYVAGTVAIDGVNVVLTLAGYSVIHTDSVTVRYDKSDRVLQDVAYPRNEAESFGNHLAENVTPPDETAPAYTGASVNGNTLTVTFNERMDPNSGTPGSAFTVSARSSDGSTRILTGTGTVTIQGTTVTVTLDGAAAYDDSLSLAYASPRSSPLRDPSRNQAGNFDTPPELHGY